MPGFNTFCALPCMGLTQQTQHQTRSFFRAFLSLVELSQDCAAGARLGRGRDSGHGSINAAEIQRDAVYSRPSRPGSLSADSRCTFTLTLRHWSESSATSSKQSNQGKQFFGRTVRFYSYSPSVVFHLPAWPVCGRTVTLCNTVARAFQLPKPCPYPAGRLLSWD